MNDLNLITDEVMSWVVKRMSDLHLATDEIINRPQSEFLLAQLSNGWVLRMKCYSFIMVVGKNSGRYVNIYRKDLDNPDDLEMIANKLKLHKNYK